MGSCYSMGGKQSQMTQRLYKEFWHKFIHRHTPFIWEKRECIETSRRDTGGKQWRRTSLILSTNLIRVKGKRWSISNQQETYNLYPFPNGNGKISPWISWWDYPRTPMRKDAIWVLVDRLTKSAHFLLVITMGTMTKLNQLYLREVVGLYSKTIVSDWDPKFTSHLLKSLQRAMGMKLKFSSAYHPQTDEKSERIVQTLEDMLRACVLDFKRPWEQHTPLIKFIYKNSYQVTIQMVSYEALYGWKCRSPICWDKVGESWLLRPKIF